MAERPNLTQAKAVLIFQERIQEIERTRREAGPAMVSFFLNGIPCLSQSGRERVAALVDAELWQQAAMLRDEIESRGFDVSEIEIAPVEETPADV